MPISTIKLLPVIAEVMKVKRYKHCGEWAYNNRILPAENAEPGRFRIERTPYFIPVAEALNNPRFSVVAVMCASQQAKSELCFNFLGHRLDTRAQPAIFVFPTQKLAESVSQTRFSKMLASSRSLSLKHQKGKSDKITLKIISGAPLIFAYATSASQMCSHACATACLDEFDRMPDDVDGEGSPLELILARLSTYPNAKCLVTSSPTLLQLSPINKLFLEGTAGKWHIRCPHCGEWVLPCFDSFKWDNDDFNKVSRAWIQCKRCQGEIGEEHRGFINKVGNGRYFYVDEEGKLHDPEKRTNNKTATFWVSGLISPWRSFHEAALRWLKAVASGSETRKQAVFNTVFGEPYEGKGEAPPPSAVKDCRLAYQVGQLKKAYSDVLFMTVDVQKDGLYYVVRGWSTTSKSALVDRGFIFGETDDPEIWRKLYRLSKKTWGKYPINYTFVDAGYRTSFVYAFCKRYGSKYIPVVGRERQRAPISSSKVEVNLKGKRFRYGLTLFVLEDTYFKEMLYSRIREAKIWFVPYDIDDEYCKQVTAESLLTDGIRKKWVKKYKHNHYLDCEKMQLFAATLFRIDLADEKKESEEKGVERDDNPTENPAEDVVESSVDKAERVIKQAAKLGSAIPSVTGNQKTEEEVEEGIRKHLEKLAQEQIDVEENKDIVSKLDNFPKKPEKNILQILGNSNNIGVNVWG